MNDELMQPLIESWLRDRQVPRPKVQTGVAEVMANLPQIRQPGGRWPLPEFRRKVRPLTTTYTVEYRPSPVPATNGHTPTVIGRTQTMFSPAKALIAGALVFALGGVMLVAQPFQQQGSLPGAETEGITPTWVTGNITYAPSCTGPDSEQDGAVRHDWDYVCSPQTWTASDPRISGVAVSRWNEDVYETDQGFVAVNMTADFVRNDDGGWACSAANLYEGFGLFPTHLTGKTATCVGQGGYEGLSAVLVIDEAEVGHPFVGLIFPGGLPPLPEPPTAE